MIIFSLLLAASLPTYAQVPPVPEIPQDLSPEIQRYLSAKRDQFAAGRSAFITEGVAHNGRCHDVPLNTPAAEDCAAARSRLTRELADLRMAADALSVEIGAAAGRKAVEMQRQIERMVALVPKVDEIERSAAADDAQKALNAAAKHDWAVALAWWKTALQKDPTNESLKRSVDLAQWTLDWRKEHEKAAAPPWTAAEDSAVNEAIDSAARGDGARALWQINAMKAEDQSLSKEADRLATGILMEETLRSETYPGPKIIPAPPPVSKTEKRALSEEVYESAFMAQLMGEDKYAEELFASADFFYMFDQGKPFESVPPKTKESHP